MYGYKASEVINHPETDFLHSILNKEVLTEIISQVCRSGHWQGESRQQRKDNGGDLVETSYMIQGLLCVRQYFQNGSTEEKALAGRADQLWKEVDFNWYRNGKNVLYWHWSPEYGWEMNFPVRGYNECLIMYVLAASSPTHGVPAAVYHEGWADNGKIKDVNKP